MNKKRESYKDFMENQGEIRERLFKIIKIEPRSMVKLAKEIGIGAMTLIGFLKLEKDVDFQRLRKIEAWIEKNEQDSGDGLDE